MEPRPSSETIMGVEPSATAAPSFDMQSQPTANPTVGPELSTEIAESTTDQDGILWLTLEDIDGEESVVFRLTPSLDIPPQQRERSRSRESRPESTERDQQVAKLWRSNQSITDIAEGIGQSVSTVYASLHRLRSQGEISAKEYFDRRYQRESIKQRDAQIMECWRAGESIQTIGKTLHWSEGLIYQTLRRLVQEGKLTADEYQGNLPRTKAWLDRAETLIPLMREDTTNEEKACLIGVTRERVRQLRKKLIKTHGEEMLLKDEVIQEKRYSLHEVCELLGINRDWVHRRIQAGTLGETLRRGKREYRLTVGQVEQLRSEHENLQQLTERTAVCKHCMQTFTYPAPYKLLNSSRKREYCSDACKKAHRTQPKAVDQASRQNPTIGQLQERLTHHQIPEDEEWVALSTAQARTGLTAMRLIYLARTQVLNTKDHPTKQWRSRPVQLYAVSQLDIVREVMSAAHEENRTEDAREDLDPIPESK